jgi:Protein of unknown function DUF262
VEPIVEVDRIDGKPRSVRELFVGRRYSVDYYQREYGWSEANVRELVEDLSGRFLGSWDQSHERSDVAGYRPYFLGPIVTDSRKGTLFLVDGQQRLTTLTLLLILLHHLQQGRSDDDRVDVRDLIASHRFGRYSFVLDVEERVACMSALLEGHVPAMPDDDDSVTARSAYMRSRTGLMSMIVSSSGPDLPGPSPSRAGPVPGTCRTGPGRHRPRTAAQRLGASRSRSWSAGWSQYESQWAGTRGRTGPGPLAPVGPASRTSSTAPPRQGHPESGGAGRIEPERAGGPGCGVRGHVSPVRVPGS